MLFMDLTFDISIYSTIRAAASLEKAIDVAVSIWADRKVTNHKQNADTSRSETGGREWGSFFCVMTLFLKNRSRIEEGGNPETYNT